MGLKFQKWQALGNDYIIIERDALPFELNGERVRRMCEAHFGCHSDGVLVLSRSSDDRFAAELRIFNPDGSEAELSGNGAREAILYLRRAGWTDRGSFTIRTAAGELRPTILSDTTCRVDMGRARDEGMGEIEGFRYQQVNVGNPQCSIRMASEAELGAVAIAEVGPRIERDPRFPNRTNVSFWAELGPGRIRARIWER